MLPATLERVQNGSSPRVSGDCNVYFALAALLLTVALPSRTTHLLAIACFVALGYDATSAYLRFLRVPVAFLLPGLLVILAFTAGDPVARLGPIVLSEAGVDRAVGTGLRSAAGVSILGYLVVTTPAPRLFAALERFRLPAFVVEFAVVTYRGIQLLATSAERLYDAAASRLGFATRRTTFRSTRYVAISLFLTTLSRAEAMDAAMRSRGYDGRMPVADRESSGHGYAAVVLLALVVAGWVP
ncbi:MAG: cobalt/nickel transport system permease protein [Halobacteriales archaeon]|jgi:cobalt/nickel transport system permease protein